MIVTVAGATTVDVSTRNVTLLEPAATVTVAGTLATVESLDVISTSAPPFGAAEANVIVACGCPCPWIDEGVTDSELPEGTGVAPPPGEGAGVGAGVTGAGVDDGAVPAPAPPHCASASEQRMRPGAASR